MGKHAPLYALFATKRAIIIVYVGTVEFATLQLVTEFMSVAVAVLAATGFTAIAPTNLKTFEPRGFSFS